MANQRATGKRMIGAQASPELWDAIDQWLRKNPVKTRTDFLIDACLEKLDANGIPIDTVAVLKDRRGRLPTRAEPETNVNYMQGRKKRPNSGTRQDGMAQVVDIVKGMAAKASSHPK
jgi:hypothetical protein